MSKQSSILGIGGGFFRSLNPDYLPHRRIIGLVLLVSVLFGVGGLAGELDLREAFLGAFNAGAAVFVGWVAGREIDPNEENSALVGAAISGVLVMVMGPIALLALIELVLLLRLLNRITGRPFLLGEYAAFFSLGLMFGFSGEPYFIGVMGAAFVIDGWLEKGKILSVYLGIGTIIGSILLWESPTPTTLTESLLIGLGLFSAGWVWFSTQYSPVVEIDSGGGKAITKRVRAAQMYLLLYAMGWFMIQGEGGIADLGPIWGAMAGALIFQAVKMVRGRAV